MDSLRGAATPPDGTDAAPRLPPVPGQLRLLVLAFWWICFLALTAAQGLGIWIGLEFLEIGELLAEVGTGFLAALALQCTAALLIRNARDSSVSLLLSFSCLCAAAYVGPAAILYVALEVEWLGALFPSLWIGLLVASLPAFPDGRFEPRWGRFLTLSAPLFTLLISADVLTDDEGVILATTLLGFGVALLALAAAVIRYRRTRPSLQRQQLKWAAFGVGGSLALLILAILLAYLLEAELFPETWLPWLAVAMTGLHDFAFAWLALGILAGLLRLRLWDADRAIGRSLAYFLLTLILAVVWAVSSTLVNDFVSAQVGSTNKGLVAALSTLIAALVFGPARERVNKWVEKRLQRGVVQLRGLPDRLAVWQHLDDPAVFGERVAGAVSGSLHAARCAVLLFENDRFRTLAAVNVDAQVVEQWIAERGSFSELEWEDRGDADFPLRMILTDEDVLIGALLLGRRSDGSFYAKEERETLLKLEPPLAAALHRVRQRTLTNRAVGSAIAALDHRLERVEQVVQKPGEGTA